MGLNYKDTKFTYKEISIVPVAVTRIRHRADCDIFYDNKQLPLIAAPMSSVVSTKNYKLFTENGIIPVLPRTEEFGERIKFSEIGFVAFSLVEFEMLIKGDWFDDNKPYYICIDIANGHMQALHDLIRLSKSIFPNIKIMSGNVASPSGYAALSNVGCDYVRVGIGGGSSCITSSNTGVHYPMASLIRDCWKESCKLDNPAAIIADGGIRGFSDITKALALGADYVMCGSIFNKMLESAGETRTVIDNTVSTGKYNLNFPIEVDQYSEITINNFKTGTKYNKIFYGMSTKRAQSEMGNSKLKTSEGIEKLQPVEYTMFQWVDNFSHYMATVMSYTDKFTIKEFIGLPDNNFVIMSTDSVSAINK